MCACVNFCVKNRNLMLVRVFHDNLSSRRHGVNSRRHGANSRRHGANSRRHGVNSRRHGANSRRHGVNSRRHGANSGGLWNMSYIHKLQLCDIILYVA